MNIDQESKDLRSYLILQGIEYTEDRVSYSRKLDNILEQNKAKTHIVCSCKLREWSNVLSMNAPIDAEYYFCD